MRRSTKGVESKQVCAKNVEYVKFYLDEDDTSLDDRSVNIIFRERLVLELLVSDSEEVR